MIFILDAYNVIHKIHSLERELDRGLMAAREALTQRCENLAKSRGDISCIYLVFDGKSQFRDLPQKNIRGVKLIFSETGESADDRIFSLLEELPRKEERRVVSDDNSVINHARVHGIKSLRVKEFEAGLKKAEGTDAKIKNHREESGEKLSQELADEISEAYRKELGL